MTDIRWRWGHRGRVGPGSAPIAPGAGSGPVRRRSRPVPPPWPHVAAAGADWLPLRWGRRALIGRPVRGGIEAGLEGRGGVAVGGKGGASAMPKRGKKKEENGSGDEAGPAPAKAPKASPAPLYEDPPTREATPDGRRWTLKVTSWNVDGLRAWLRKGGAQWVQEEAPDVLCLQETKCAVSAVPAELRALPGLPHQFWSSAKDRPGYSGVGLLARTEPLEVTYGIGDPEHDVDGRVVTAEFPSLFVVSAYVPNAGRGLVRLEPRLRFDAAFLRFLQGLDARKPVLLCGDLNVAHAEIDLCHPRANRASAGFTPQEREGFTRLLEAGFVDSFRHLYPEARGAFTFWTYLGGARARNVGWRLDYAVVSRRLLGALCDCKIRSAVQGSDHCPVTALLAV